MAYIINKNYRTLYIIGTIILFIWPLGMINPDLAAAGIATAYAATAHTANGPALIQDAEPNYPQKDAQNTENGDPWYSTKVEKRKFKLMLAASIAILVGFFIAVLLTSLLRMGRYYRQRTLSRAKRQQTDYEDIWSKYRLKDGWEKDLLDDQK